MNQQQRFTACADRHGLNVTFDDGDNRTYGEPTADAILRILADTAGEPATFSAMTTASFLEAEHAHPNPSLDGPLLQLARPRAGTIDLADGIALGPLATHLSRPLADVLAARRSERHLGPPSLDDLATVLVRSDRVVDWSYDDEGTETSLRPHPSAGAVHPLTIHVIADDVTGLDSGCWVFDPFRCTLNPAQYATEAVDRARDRIARAARVAAAPATFVVVANPARTLYRYPRGTAHLWRDTGILLATLHLVAADLGLASSIVGTSGVLSPFDPATDGIVDVGALVIGRHPG